MWNKESILEYFLNENGLPKFCHIFEKRSIIKHIGEKEYINLINFLNTFEHLKKLESIQEKIYCLKNNINEFLKCPVCGKYRRFISFKNGYTVFCSIDCKNSNKGKEIMEQKKVETCMKHFGVPYSFQSKNNKIKSQQTCLKRFGTKSHTQSEIFKKEQKQRNIKKYGVEYACQTNEIKEKIKQTKVKKYGDPYYRNSKKAEETCFKKYGVKSFMDTSIFREKSKETNIKKYGVENPSKNKLIAKKLSTIISSEECQNKTKETCKKRYGVEYVSQSPKFREMANETKAKNHTFNSSKIEELVHDYLICKFGKNNVKQNYNKDVRYPWHVDFYISNIDLFIEVQGYVSHGGHPFNSNDSNDLQKLEYWKNMANNNSKVYESYIKTWTVSDCKKRETAQKNKLKYFEFFGTNINQFKNKFEKFLMCENLENEID